MVNVVAATPSVNNHSYSNKLTKYEAMEIYIFAVVVAYLVGACANLFPRLDRAICLACIAFVSSLLPTRADRLSGQSMTSSP